MSAENKAIAERLLDRFNARDFEAMRELFAEDYVNHNPPPFPGADAGRDGQLMAIQALAAAFPDSQAEVINVIAEGDKVVVHDIVRGTHEGELMGIAPTGSEITVDFIHIFRIANGKIAERWGLIDAMSLMTQIGAIPAMGAAAGATR